MSDVPRDEHLMAALRHAPDAQALPPAHLSAQILAAAHRAAAEPAHEPARSRRWFVTPWRLGPSGAFATLALAGVLGLLWRAERPGPASEAPVDLPALSQASAPPPAPAEAARDEARSATGQRIVAERAAATQARKAPAPPPPTAERGAASPPPAQAAAPAPAPAAAPAAAPVAADAQATATTAAAASPTPLPAPSMPALAAETRAFRAAPPALAEARRPRAHWMDALAAGAATNWTLDGQAWAPAAAWLQALATQTQGRWQAAPAGAAMAEGVSIEWADGRGLLGRLWLGDARVLWCDAASRCEAAVLDEGAGAAMRRSLPR